MKLFLLLLAAIVFFFPLIAKPTDGFNSPWHVDFALAVLLAICLFYAAQARMTGARLTFTDLILIGAFPLYLLFVGNETTISSADNAGTRNLPVGIVLRHTLDLSWVPQFQNGSLPYSILKIEGRLHSGFPLGTAIVAVPYAGIALLASHGQSDAWRIAVWEKHFSALLCIATALIFFLALRSKFGDKAAAYATLVLALCTTFFTTPAQSMASFTGELFFFAMALYLILKKDRTLWNLVLAGVCMGFAFFCRPTAALIVLLLSTFLFQQDRRSVLPFGAAFLIIATGVVFFHFYLYGHPGGGYTMLNTNQNMINEDFGKAFIGNLVSPSRGLLIYYPFLILLPFSWRLAGNDRDWKHFFILGAMLFALLLLIVSFYANWWGGFSLGPRLFTELSPFLAIMLIPLFRVQVQKRWKRALAVFLFAIAACTQILGAYNPVAYRWNAIVNVDYNPAARWSWRYGQIAATWIPNWQFTPSENFQAESRAPQ